MNKSITLNINRRVIISIFLGIAIGFTVTFLLQLKLPYYCDVILEQQKHLTARETEFLKIKHLEFEQYLEQLGKKELRTKEELAFYIHESNFYVQNYLTQKYGIVERDSYPDLKPVYYEPCNTQSFHKDFKTFFGNTVHSDLWHYGTSIYVSEDEVQAQKAAGKIALKVNDYKIVDKGHYPPLVEYSTKFRVFANSFSQCDCESSSQKVKGYARAMVADYIPALIMGLAIGIFLSLIWKFNFKIKITK